MKEAEMDEMRDAVIRLKWIEGVSPHERLFLHIRMAFAEYEGCVNHSPKELLEQFLRETFGEQVYLSREAPKALRPKTSGRRGHSRFPISKVSLGAVLSFPLE